MTGQSVQGLLFDIDGTLIDSNWQHAVAWSRALQETAHPGIPTASVHHAIGMASDQLLTTLTGEVDDDVAERHDELLHDMAPHIVALPGAAELLDECRQAGYETVLVTSAGEEDLEWMLPLIGGRSAVSRVITAADVEESKPSSEPFDVALRQAGLPASACVVVGDSVWDMQSAHNADIRAIGLTCGGTPSVDLFHAGAGVTFPGPADLLERMRADGMQIPG